MTTSNQTLDQTAPSPQAIPLLEAEHLHKEFPIHQVNVFGKPMSVHAVEDTTLTLRAGRATALVGESGSGKTTVARMLARVYDPTSGAIRYRGESIKLTHKASDLRSYRRHVQLIFQDPFGSLNPVHN